MELEYKNTDFKRDEQFISIFAFGLISALRDDLITCDDAWNWLLNIRTLEMVKASGFNKNIVNAIHLSTELENVKRIIPNAFLKSCDEILELLKEVLKENSFNDKDVIKYLLELKE